MLQQHVPLCRCNISTLRAFSWMCFSLLRFCPCIFVLPSTFILINDSYIGINDNIKSKNSLLAKHLLLNISYFYPYKYKLCAYKIREFAVIGKRLFIIYICHIRSLWKSNYVYIELSNLFWAKYVSFDLFKLSNYVIAIYLKRGGYMIYSWSPGMKLEGVFIFRSVWITDCLYIILISSNINILPIY